MRGRVVLRANAPMLAVAAFVLAIPKPGQAAPAIEVTATSANVQYVLGEPVVLNLTVKNAGRETILAYPPVERELGVCPDIVTYIAPGDADFERFLPRPCGGVVRERIARALQPGDSWRYELRPYYSDAGPRQLAFPAPGEYRVKFTYPLSVADGPDTGGVDLASSRSFESNIVALRVVEPRNLDAQVWRTINTPGFQFFLQWGAAPAENQDVPFQAAELLKSVSYSRYHAGLRWAVKSYYESGVRPFDEYEAELFRSVAGIELPPPQPFPDDKRLDQIVTYHLSERTTLDELFKMISEQTGVEFQVHPALRIRSMRGARVTHPLRELMRHVSAYKAEWVREAGGYTLRPTEPPRDAQD